jgi:hypothetical protein
LSAVVEAAVLVDQAQVEVVVAVVELEVLEQHLLYRSLVIHLIH